MLWQAKWTDALTKWEASLPSDLGPEMWMAGIPPRCRPRVWPVLLGNAAKVTPDVFNLSLARAKRLRRLKGDDSFFGGKGSGQGMESSLLVRCDAGWDAVCCPRD